MDITIGKVNVENAKWVLDAKEKTSSIESMAIELVINELENEFRRETGTELAHFEETKSMSIVNYGSWQIDGIYKVIIDGEFYVLNHIYVCKENKIVVVCKDNSTMDALDVDHHTEIDELDDVYFTVGY